MRYSYMVSDSTITVTFSDGTTKVLDRSHPQAGQVLEALRDEAPEDEIAAAFGRAESIKRYMHGNVTVNEDGSIVYMGAVVHNTVCDRIIQFMKQGLPFEPLVRFLDRLMKNPSFRSVESLYGFLVHQDITIDTDGFLICYKAVTGAYRDKHSGTIDNTPGRVVQMARNQIDDNPDSACSQGLHAGSIQYVRGFADTGDRIVLVRIDPANVVSVPRDCDAQKMRVCEYTVMTDVTDKVITDVAPSPLFGAEPADSDGFDDFGDPIADEDDDREEPKTIRVGNVRITVPPGMEVDVDGADGEIEITVLD